MRRWSNSAYDNYRILIIDNGSTDGSVDVLRSLGNRVTLIEEPENLGYTGGNNRAMREAFDQGADYAWLFNNDAVTDPDTLVRLIETCEADARIGLTSPLVREKENHDAVEFACGLIRPRYPTYTPCYEVDQAREWQMRFPDALHSWALPCWCADRCTRKSAA